jgi:hypothetical protein
MDTVATRSTEALVVCSIGSFFLAGAVNVAASYAFSGPPSSDFGRFMVGGAWVAGFFSVACFAYGVWLLYRKSSMLKKIRSQSTTQVIQARIVPPEVTGARL